MMATVREGWLRGSLRDLGLPDAAADDLVLTCKAMAGPIQDGRRLLDEGAAERDEWQRHAEALAASLPAVSAVLAELDARLALLDAAHGAQGLGTPDQVATRVLHADALTARESIQRMHEIAAGRAVREAGRPAEPVPVAFVAALMAGLTRHRAKATSATAAVKACFTAIGASGKAESAIKRYRTARGP